MSDSETLRVLRGIVMSDIPPLAQLIIMIMLLHKEHYTDERIREFLADMKKRAA